MDGENHTQRDPAENDAAETALCGSAPWVDFSGIDNPLGTPSDVVSVLKRLARTGTFRASSLNMTRAREHLARRFKADPSSFLCGTTIKSMVRAVARSFDPVTVGVMAPGMRDHSLAVAEAGCTPIGIPSPTGFSVPEPSFARAGGTALDAVVLANPGYPGSRLLPKATLERYLEECSWAVVDERSIELSLGGESMIPLVAQHENLIIVRSFTEAFALPGVPIGFLVAHPRTIKRIEAAGEGVATALTVALCEETNRHLGFLERTRDILETEIPWLQCMLSLVPGITIYPAEANFVLCRLVPPPSLRCSARSVADLDEALHARGFAINRLEGVPGLPDDTFFCVSVRQRSDNDQLIRALRAIMTEDGLSAR